MATKTRLDLPFKQAAGDGGVRSATQLVVVHATDNTASAEGEASYASWRPDGTSAHVYVDGDSAVQALLLDHVAYGCFPTGNGRSIQFELCGRSNAIPPATVTRAANLIAVVCHLWGIPAVHITPSQARAGVKGIIGHDGVTAAWGEGDHTDPGSSFPWSAFILQVKAELNRLAGLSTPTPVPATTLKVLRRPWPTYMQPGNYFGLITGPDVSHGGYFTNERADIKAIQQRLIALGYVPGITNPASGWADGIFEQPTADAVARWQRAKYAQYTSRYGEVWSDDWVRLFTY